MIIQSARLFKIERWLLIMALPVLIILFMACGGDETGQSSTSDSSETTAASSEQSDLSGRIKIRGATSVFPITKLMSDEFQKSHPAVEFDMLATNTGKGFVEFVRGDLDLVNASRPMNKDEEEGGSTYSVNAIGLQIALDGVSIVVHPSIDFVDCLTVEELKNIWGPDSDIDNWNKVRTAFPNKPLTLYGPTPVNPKDIRLGGSGTYDYFTENVIGVLRSSRLDFTSAADPNILVENVSNDENALGYFAYGFYSQNQDKLKLLAVDSGEGCVSPSQATIGSTYPLSRPLFVYINIGPRGPMGFGGSIFNPAVAAFLNFYLSNPNLISQAGYVPATDEVYQEGKDAVISKTTRGGAGYN